MEFSLTCSQGPSMRPLDYFRSESMKMTPLAPGVFLEVPSTQPVLRTVISHHDPVPTVLRDILSILP